MVVHLVQCGPTQWQGESRMQGRLSLPLSAAGESTCQASAAQLAGVDLAGVYAPPDEACIQTARAIAKNHKGCRVRQLAELAELDLGLWQGLSSEAIKRRQPKVYRAWVEQPQTVTPPEGEALENARGRIGAAIKQIVDRHGRAERADVAIVVRSIAAGLVRCCLSGRRLTDIWRMVDRRPQDMPEKFEPIGSGKP